MWLWSGSANTVTCFYCNSTLTLLPPAPTRAQAAKGKHRQSHLGDDALRGRGNGAAVAVGTRNDFWCAVCGQITRKDEDGQILSDEAAHHDPTLNQDSFALKGTAARDRLPTSFPSTSTTPFCRQCLSNQALQLHLLASYPLDQSGEASPSDARSGGRRRNDSSTPDPDVDPYPPLDEYRRSLDLRYPLVCAECAPVVESTIRERDYRVKAQALGWRLRETQRRREEEEKRSDEARRREGRSWVVQGVVWRVRGVAWAGTHFAAIAAAAATVVGAHHGVSPPRIQHPLPLALNPTLQHVLLLTLALLSLFWSFWDPTWHAARLERARGRDFVARYRAAYLVRVEARVFRVLVCGQHAEWVGYTVPQAVQMLAYLARLVGVAALWLRDAMHPSKGFPWIASTVLVVAITALTSAFLIPTLQPRTPLRLGTRAVPCASLSTSSALASADPLEPLANLSLSHNGSLLVPSPPRTPTSATRLKQPEGAKPGEARGGRRGSFSLGLRSWRGSPSPLGPSGPSVSGERETPGPDLDAAANTKDNQDAAETSMDWCPTPPPSTTPASYPGYDSPSSARLASAVTNHITFARQRFVPPDTRKPTGLEGMFERVVAVRDEGVAGGIPKVGRDVEMKSVTSPAEPEGSRAWLAGWWK